MKRRTLLFCLCIFILYSCSPKFERTNYVQGKIQDTSNCTLRINYNNYLMRKSQAIGTAVFSGNIFTTDCSKQNLLDTIRQEACNIGANAVNIYNIEEPGIFNHCYRAYVDFYNIDPDTLAKEDQKDTVKAYDYRTKVVPEISGKYDDPKHEILLCYGYDFIGSDSYMKLINDLSKSYNQPTPPFALSLELGIDYTYWFDHLGINAGYNYLPQIVASDFDNYKMSLSIYKLGFSGVLLSSRKTSDELKRVFLRGGINYSTLSIFNPNTSTDLLGEGVGFYFESGIFFGLSQNLIVEGIIGYEATNSKIPSLDDQYGLYKIYFLASFGFTLR